MGFLKNVRRFVVLLAVAAVAGMIMVQPVTAVELTPSRELTAVRYSYKIISKTQLSNEYSPYYQAGIVRYLQPGALYPRLTGQTRSTEYSMSVKLGTPIPNLSTTLGVKVANGTISLSGVISPPARSSKPYVRPYYRKAWKRWSVVEQVTATTYELRTGKTVSTSTKKVTSTVRVPFADSKCVLFGFAKTKAELGSTIALSSDLRFRQ